MQADRPHMPGYGITTHREGLLPWSWAVRRLTDGHNYWLATTGPGGVPHLAAVWAVYHDGALWFSTGVQSRKARNLTAEPRCSIAPQDAAESVVVEGLAERITEAPVRAEVDAVYREKYASGMPDTEPVFAVRPVRVIGIVEQEPDFSARATRWRPAKGQPITR